MKNKKWLIVPVIIFFVICLGEMYVYTEEDAWEELLALDVNITMEELMKKGYVDVSDVMSSPDKEISNFFTRADNGQNAILKVANVIDGKLTAKILRYNKEYDVIKMWTVYPNCQQGENPGKCFSVEFYEVEEDGVVNVFLKHVLDVSLVGFGTGEYVDEKLYSYLEE